MTGPARGQIVIVGSMNMDLTVVTDQLPLPGETVVGSTIRQYPGGKGANQAVSASLLGGKVSIIAQVGADHYGKSLLDSALNAGVDITHVAQAGSVGTGTAIITVDRQGENSIVISPGANGALDSTYVRSQLNAISDISVVSVCLEIPLESVREALMTAQSLGATTVLNFSPIDLGAKKFIQHADVLIVNQHELLLLLESENPITEWHDLIPKIRNLAAKSVIVTLGGDGAMVLDSKIQNAQFVHVPAIKVDVVDTTGCGDAFAGALCSELASGKNLLAAAEFAVKVAGYAAKAPGAQNSYGTRSQVLAS